MGDEVAEALDQLVDGLRRNAARVDQAIELATRARDQRVAGRSWSDIVASDPSMSIVTLVGENLGEIHASGGRFRRVLARALHDEGMSMEAIARVFGVTRQRVSALLRSSPAGVRDHGERF